MLKRRRVAIHGLPLQIPYINKTDQDEPEGKQQKYYIGENRGLALGNENSAIDQQTPAEYPSYAN